MKHLLFISYLCFYTFVSWGQPNLPKSQIFENGVVVSAHPEATLVGSNILKMGGNAVDAAVAIQFALAVVYPNAGNIGGGGFMIYADKKGNISALDFREKAPLKAHKDMYLDEKGEVIKNKSLYGSLAAGVPGSVKGMAEAHKKYGSLPWEQLINPAIILAGQGYPITERQANLLNEYQERFLKYNQTPNAFTSTKAWKKGDIFIQSDLAQTLSRIAKKGPNGFYKGKTARLVRKHMKRNNGIIATKDLKNYNAVWRQPIEISYKDYKVITMPPPSSGGIALGQLLKMVESRSLEKIAFEDPLRYNILAEAEKRVYADRSKYLGDPDFVKVPLQGLMDSLYCTNRMSNFVEMHATPQQEINYGMPEGYESTETTHFSVADKNGTLVSITTTLNGNYGSSVVVEGAGFLLNNEMDDFSAKPGTPNMFGLIGSKANQIEPNKRMLSSMTPTIIKKDNMPIFALGSPGGGTIITTVFQVVLNLLEYKMDLEKAVNKSRFHHQWTPDLLFLEQNQNDESFVKRLNNIGYKIERPNFLGCVGAVQIREDGTFLGVGDKRGDDCAAGF